MIKQEITELKKLFNQSKCSIDRICGCYVDGEKDKKTTFAHAFLTLPDEEMFKYFEIFKKSLSGSLGKNLMNLEFPLATEEAGGTQAKLLALRDSKLKDDALLNEFYDSVIENYEYVGNYLILLIHDVYDVPGKTTDGIEMDDASDEIYEYILFCICPVNLSKPGLSYDMEENNFRNRIRDWVVDKPEKAFLFPAFNDRSSDIHSTLYYTKNPEELKGSFVEAILNCPLPLTAGSQKDSFQAIVEETLGDNCSIEAVINIHEKLSEMAEEHKEDPIPLSLDKEEVKSVLEESGLDEEVLENFDHNYSELAGPDTSLCLSNVVNTRTFEVKTPDVMIKVKPDRTDLIKTKEIDGIEYIIIPVGPEVSVNGISIHRPSTEDTLEE